MLTIGSLCTGAAGLDLAVGDVLGELEPAWVAEVDQDASQVLAFRIGAPNLGDITAVDWTRVEPVDVLAAGYPCTDLSNAGRRAGIEGAHSGIWRNVADAIRHLRPRLVVLENVAAHLARGFGRVVGDLAAIGYDTQWLCLQASDVGAPHRRDRVFIVAAPADPGSEHLRLEPVTVAARRGAAVAGGHSSGSGGVSPARPALLPTPVARDHKGTGYRGQLGTALLPTPTASRADESRTIPSRGVGAARFAQGRRMLDDAIALLPTPTATDANASRNATANRSHIPATTNAAGWTLHDVAYADRWAQYGPAIARWETILGRPAPEPVVTGKRGGRRLSGRFVEWLMGWPDGWVTDLVDNTAALRICGNGVVRRQGAAAVAALLGAVA